MSFLGAVGLVLLSSGCASGTRPTTSGSSSPGSAPITTAIASTTSTSDDFTPTTPQQQAIARILHQLGADYLNDSASNLPSGATYHQQWEAAQPLVTDTTAAEHLLNELTWPSDALGTKSKVISDLQAIHDLVAAPPQPNFPGPPNASVKGLNDDFTALTNDIGDLLTAVGGP